MAMMMMMMMMMTLISRCHSDGSYGMHRRGDAPFECYWLHPANVKPGRGVGYMPPLQWPFPWGSLAHTSVSPKRHLDQFSRFSGLTGVPNTNTERPRYNICSNSPHLALRAAMRANKSNNITHAAECGNYCSVICNKLTSC